MTEIINTNSPSLSGEKGSLANIRNEAKDPEMFAALIERRYALPGKELDLNSHFANDPVEAAQHVKLEGIDVNSLQDPVDKLGVAAAKISAAEKSVNPPEKQKQDFEGIRQNLLGAIPFLQEEKVAGAAVKIGSAMTILSLATSCIHPANLNMVSPTSTQEAAAMVETYQPTKETTPFVTYAENTPMPPEGLPINGPVTVDGERQKFQYDESTGEWVIYDAEGKPEIVWNADLGLPLATDQFENLTYSIGTNYGKRPDLSSIDKNVYQKFMNDFSSDPTVIENFKEYNLSEEDLKNIDFNFIRIDWNDYRGKALEDLTPENGWIKMGLDRTKYISFVKYSKEGNTLTIIRFTWGDILPGELQDFFIKAGNSDENKFVEDRDYKEELQDFVKKVTYSSSSYTYEP